MNNSKSVDELLTKPAGVLIKTTLVDFPGKVASAYFLRGCNLRCPYCYNVELVSAHNDAESTSDNQAESLSINQDFVSPVQVLEHLYKRKSVMNGLVISGGEPLLNPVTPELIRQAKKMGYSIKLDTNGTLPLILEKLMSDRETCPDFIAMDIKTSPERYKTDIPVIKNFIHSDIKALLQSSLKLISQLGKNNYEIRTVLVPGLVDTKDIENIAALLPQDASWQFAQFRNENCIDPSYNQITPYIDSKIEQLINFARSMVSGAKLR